MILRLTYIFFSILVTLYGVFKKRKFDFVFIYFLSSSLYFFPLYLGVFQSFVFGRGGKFSYMPQEIYYKCYLILLVNSGVCFLAMFIKDHSKFLRNKTEIRETLIINEYANILILILGFFILIHQIYMINRLHNYIFTDEFNKSVLLRQLKLTDTYCIDMSYFIFILSYSFDMRWRKTTRLLSAVLMLFPLMLSKRSEVVCGLISIIYIWINKTEYHSLWELLKKRKKQLGLGMIFFVAVFLSKPVINSIVQGNWKAVVNQLSKDNTLINSFLYSEPNIITSTLNEILRLDLRVNGESYIFSSLGFFPFINTLSNGYLVPKDFYKLYQPVVYPDLTGWGAGNCFLGETYSNGGFLLLAGMIIFLCVILILSEKYLYRGKNIWLKASALAIIPWMAFYIHRNSWYYTVRSVRKFFYFAIMLNILYVLFVIKHPRYSK